MKDLQTDCLAYARLLDSTSPRQPYNGTHTTLRRLYQTYGNKPVDTWLDMHWACQRAVLAVHPKPITSDALIQLEKAHGPDAVQLWFNQHNRRANAWQA